LHICDSRKVDSVQAFSVLFDLLIWFNQW